MTTVPAASASKTTCGAISLLSLRGSNPTASRHCRRASVASRSLRAGTAKGAQALRKIVVPFPLGSEDDQSVAGRDLEDLLEPFTARLSSSGNGPGPDERHLASSFAEHGHALGDDLGREGQLHRSPAFQLPGQVRRGGSVGNEQVPDLLHQRDRGDDLRQRRGLP